MRIVIAPSDFTGPTTRDRLLEAGFSRVDVEPRTSGTASETYRRGDDLFKSASIAWLATHAWIASGPNEDAIAAEWIERHGGVTVESIALAPSSADPLVRLRQVYALGVMSLYLQPLPAEALDRLCFAVADPVDVIRWAALGAPPISDAFLAAVCASAEQHAEMSATAARLRVALDAAGDGTLGDAPTNDMLELERRAVDGALAGQWKRVELAARAWLEEHPWSPAAAHYLGLACTELGRPLEALIFSGAAGGDADEEDTSQWVAFEDHAARTAALRAKAANATPEEQLAAADLAELWLDRWATSSKYGMRRGLAEALAGLVPELEPSLLAIRAAWGEEERHLFQRAAELLPGSISLAYDMALAGPASDKRAALEALLTRLRADEPEPSERFVRIRNGGFTKPVTESSVLGALAHVAYEAKDFVAAYGYADAAVGLDVDDANMWQVRANSLIFGGRTDEALQACRDAAANVERILADPEMIFFGHSPNGPVRFNLACVAAKLGHRDEALENLRLAILADEKFAADALADDYFAPLVADPELIAICQQDPRALRTAEERDPAALRARMYAARDLLSKNRPTDALAASERVVELAGWVEDPALQAESLTVLMRALLFNGRPDEATAAIEQALAIAGGPGVPKESAAIVHAHAALRHQMAGDLGGAERSFEHALALRREAFGPAHPVLAKTIGSLVGVAVERGATPEVWLPRAEEGIAIAEAFLASDPVLDHVWAEAIDDLVALLLRATVAKLLAQDAAGAAEVIASAIARVEQQRRLGVEPMVAHLESLDGLAREGLKLADAATSVALAQLRDRIGAALHPGSPAEAAVRATFRDLRTWLTQLRMQGVADVEIAADLGSILRTGPIAERLARSPAAVSLRATVARVSMTAPTLLVTAALALSIAETPGKLDEGLGQLEELLAAHADGG